ncbi:MAG: acyl--CoA ligase [Muribaculaceae bacterium]|nr:acyl--CoA ligase [Muribaculaceae bacterium]
MIPISHSHLLSSIFKIASEHPEAIAVVTENNEEISYADLSHNILRAAAYLKNTGISAGDRIIISALKEVEFIYFYFAAHLIGAVNVVVDAKNNAANLPYILEQTRPALGLGVEFDAIHSQLFEDITLPSLKPDDGDLYTEGLSENDTADIMFTSGTTGNPKGVLLSHANLFGSASNINSFIGNSSDDVELLGLPICHSFGLGRLRCNLIVGAKVVLHNGFANLKSVFNTIQRYGVTGFGMVPAVWAYIKRFSGQRIAAFAPQLRYIEIGSAALPREDKELLCQLFPYTRICMHYGLTEASRSAFSELHIDREFPDSIGRPVCSNVDILIFDDNGSPLPDGQAGEICVKGNMVTKGYLNPQDNAEAFHGMYFRTGDGGYRDSDGRLYLTARLKEIINVGGKKVNPVELEETVKEICGAESMAVAMADPDGILGEVPKLLIVRDSFSISREELNIKLQEVLAPYKRPRFIEIVDALPLTANGKKRRSLTSAD